MAIHSCHRVDADQAAASHIQKVVTESMQMRKSIVPEEMRLMYDELADWCPTDMCDSFETIRSIVPEDIIDATTEQDITLLHYAVTEKNLMVVQALLGLGANVDARTEAGSTPLHLASREGYSELASVLITAGADVDATYSRGDTLRGHVNRCVNEIRRRPSPALIL